MKIRKKSIDEKVKKYVDQLFSDVGPSQQLFDLKEELTTNLKEKIADYQSRGMDEDQAFKEAVISLGDLRGLVDEMRQIGQDTAKQAVYSSMTARISTAGIITGVLLVLFGLFTVTMLFFMMGIPIEGVVGPGIFVVVGMGLITYSVLIRETKKRYAMNKIRAALYGLSVGLILYGIYTGLIAGLSTGEVYIAISSTMVFVLAGVGLLLYLLLTEIDRRKVS